MLIIQKFHSIHEIDAEFVSSIELLLQEEISGFDVLIDQHDSAPASDVFTYFLFFGPTQNAPIGFAQVCIRHLPGKEFLSWYKKLRFWNKEHEHWKEVIWQVGTGGHGLCVFDSRFARTGKEKVQELINQYQERDDIMAQRLFCLENSQDFNVGWPEEKKITTQNFVLGPLPRSFKTYQEYLANLQPHISKQIKSAWKALDASTQVKLGDYSEVLEAPKGLPFSEDQLKTWSALGRQLLTFEKTDAVLGCLLLAKGKNGNVFIEPFPFEPEGQAIVSDELYIQYAILKFFEMPDARKCHLMKFGSKLSFQHKEDLSFFTDQGFTYQTVLDVFCSRLEGLDAPL